MIIKRAILLGVIIWFIGILLYTVSFYVPILENVERQANLVLFIAVMPLVWFASYFYYKVERKTHGYKVGLSFLFTAIVLDAIITVPLLIIPNGGNHYSFFTTFEFWMIAAEFFFVTVLFYYIKIYPQKHSTQKHSTQILNKY